MPESPADPYHEISGPTTSWSRVNSAEAVIGVQTPLSLTYWDHGGELGFRLGYVEMGLLPRKGVRIPASIDEQYTGFFWGRCATNLDSFRTTLAAMPGSVDAAEEGIFAATTSAGSTKVSRWGRARAKVLLPVSAVVLPWRLRRLRNTCHTYWTASTAPGALPDFAAAKACFEESMEQFAPAIDLQVVASTFAGIYYGKIQSLLAEIDRTDLELQLIGGYGAMSEIQITKDLARIARGDHDLAAFLAEHGFHGPAEGEMSSRSWREDPGPVERMIETFRNLSTGNDPEAAEKRQLAERALVEQTVRGASTGWARVTNRVLIALCRKYIPLRVEAKAAYTEVLDVARAAARAMGADLVARGVLDEVDDVFFITRDELLGSLPADVRAVVAERRRLRLEYESFELPLTWVGNPERIDSTHADDAEGGGPSDELFTLTAVGVSPGAVEGVARVLLDASDPDALQPGEVLVCHITDPSWSAYFFVAAAVVIDIGGPLSHGPIVARELGIPCVVNTENGTRTLRSGDRVRVDGNAGTVEVLSAGDVHRGRAAAHPSNTTVPSWLVVVTSTPT